MINETIIKKRCSTCKYTNVIQFNSKYYDDNGNVRVGGVLIRVCEYQVKKGGDCLKLKKDTDFCDKWEMAGDNDESNN